MNEEEYEIKYLTVILLKSIQEYLKTGSRPDTAVYPVKVPDDLLYQMVKLKGPEETDKLIDSIFKLGLSIWSEKQYDEVFGSSQELEAFIDLVKKRKNKSVNDTDEPVTE